MEKRFFLKKGMPFVSLFLLAVILTGCIFAGALTKTDPAFFDLERLNAPPDLAHPFGADPMGRDLFSMIWHGGRVSLFVGGAATVISTAVAMIYGALSGVAPDWLDRVLMRAAELLLSIPSILVVLFVQAFLGQSTPMAIAFVIGITSWMNIAKVVRTQVRTLRRSGFVLAAKHMGGGFFYLLRRHLAPNLLPAILFMVVTNLGTAIGTEATLSFLGIGLPLETVSWGSMLSMADRAFLSGNWRLILIPGIFLVTTLCCITNIGDSIRKEKNPKCSNFV